MAESSTRYLKPCANSTRYKFRSTRHLQEFLGISAAFDNCIAYAPYAKNAPHCSHPVNKANRSKAPYIVNELSVTKIPSLRAAQLLGELSSCAVCSVTKRHQEQATGIYGGWCQELWGEYLRANGLDSRLCDWVPAQLTRSIWEDDLEDARFEQELESDQDDDEYDSDDESFASIETPNSSISDFDLGPSSSEQVPSDSGGGSETPTASSSDGSSSQDDTPDHSEEEEATTDSQTDEDNLDTTEDHTSDNEPSNLSFPPDLLALPDIFETLGSPSDTQHSVSSSEESINPPRPSFSLYPQLLPTPNLKALLHTITQTISPRSRRTGYIYAFARPSLPDFLKIGYTFDTVVPNRPYPDPVANRLHRWEADCGHPVVEIFRAHIPCRAVRRIESLVHQTLREYRRIEERCSECKNRARRKGQSGGGKHNEWFEVGVESAQRIVELWRLFAEELPYDRFGRLDDVWSGIVEGERGQVGDGVSAMEWLGGIGELVAEARREMFREILGPLTNLSLG